MIWSVTKLVKRFLQMVQRGQMKAALSQRRICLVEWTA